MIVLLPFFFILYNDEKDCKKTSIGNTMVSLDKLSGSICDDMERDVNLLGE